MGFADLTARLSVDTKPFAKGLRDASKQAKKFAGDLHLATGGAAGLTAEAHKSAFAFKDVSRVIQGIILSRVFYAGLQAVAGATDAVWEFSKSLEYAQIAYSNLFGNAELATEFINVLKDFSAETPFAFSDSEAAARRLLAYGMEYKNVMFVMQGILSASSMTGDPQTIERVSRSLGQIYTKGRLMNEELRQLAEAGVPVYDILEEKLGLTKKQIAEIGRERVPASKAINALVEGMNERFGGVVEGATKTIQGRLSNIKDNLMIFASTAIQPLLDKLKVVFASIEGFVKDLRSTLELSGMGGVFEKFVPKQLQADVKMFLATLGALFRMLVGLSIAGMRFSGVVLVNMMRLFNAMAPVILPLLGALTYLLDIVTRNEAVMKAISVVLIAAGVAFSFFASKMVLGFLLKPLITLLLQTAAAFKFLAITIATNPVYLVIGILVGAFITLVLSIDRARMALYSFYNSLTKIAGIDMNKMLLPSQNKRAADLGKFNKALGGTASNMDDLAKKTGKAAKAARMLLSFDEVFSLKTPDEGAGAGGAGGIDAGDVSIPDVGVPGVPDFGTFAKEYVQGLFDSIKDRLTTAAFGALVGGAIGAVIGGAFGNPVLGAAIGALAGAIIGYFWEDIKEKLGLSEGVELEVGIAAAIGGIFGLIVGGPIGAAIGTLVGGILGVFWDMLVEEFELGPTAGQNALVGGAIGAAIGAITFGPIGAAIGFLVGSIGGTFWEKLEAFYKDRNNIPATIGGSIGTAVGGALGAGLGGNVVGTWIGDLGNTFWDLLKEAFTDPTKFDTLFTDFGDALIAALGGREKILKAPGVEWLMGFAEGLGEKELELVEWFRALPDKLLAEFKLNTPSLGGEGSSYITSMLNGMKNTWEDLKTWASGRASAIDSYISSSTSALYAEGKSFIQGLLNGMKNIWNGVSDWVRDRPTAIQYWLRNKMSNGSVLYAAGKSIVQGLWNGMRYVWLKLATWLSGLATWIRNHKGPISKDRVLLVDAGKAIMTGLKAGMDAVWPTIMKDVVGYGHSIAGAFADVDASINVKAGTPRLASRVDAVAKATEPASVEQQAQPIITAIADGITASLMPTLTRIAAPQEQLQPLYVGALIADERGLRELNRKMNVIQLKEDRRKG